MAKHMYMVYEVAYFEDHFPFDSPICICSTVKRAEQLVSQYKAESKKSFELTKKYNQWKDEYLMAHPIEYTSSPEEQKLISEKNKILNNTKKVDRTQEMLDRVVEIAKYFEQKAIKQEEKYAEFERARDEYINTFPEAERKLIDIKSYRYKECAEYGYKEIELRDE